VAIDTLLKPPMSERNYTLRIEMSAAGDPRQLILECDWKLSTLVASASALPESVRRAVHGMRGRPGQTIAVDQDVTYYISVLETES
jgi:hypothetical protein